MRALEKREQHEKRVEAFPNMTAGREDGW